MTHATYLMHFFYVLSAALLFYAIHKPAPWFYRAAACAGFVIAMMKAQAHQVLVLLGG